MGKNCGGVNGAAETGGGSCRHAGGSLGVRSCGVGDGGGFAEGGLQLWLLFACGVGLVVSAMAMLAVVVDCG